jgi:hypothetical protein
VAATSSSERLLKGICGSCLILAPGLLLVGGLIHPEETTDAARQFEIIAANVDRWELSHWIISASMVLMVGAVVGLAHLLHQVRAAEAIIGGAVTLVGVLLLFSIASWEAAIVPEIAGSNSAEAGSIFERIVGSGGYWVVLAPTLLLPLGLIVMSYGLFRGRVAPAWAAANVGVGALLFGISLPTGSPWLFAIGLVLVFVGLGRVGLTVLSESDEQWKHPPQASLRGPVDGSA